VLGEPRLLSMKENPLRETSDHILYTSLYLSWMARAITGRGILAERSPQPFNASSFSALTRGLPRSSRRLKTH